MSGSKTTTPPRGVRPAMSSSSNEEDGIRRYTVYATNPSNTTETEALLMESFGSDNVVPGQSDNGVGSWTITSHGKDLTDAINKLAGVRIAHQETVSPTHPSQFGRRLNRRDDETYIVVPIPGSDLKKIEDFIQSKVQPGTIIGRVTDESRILAWLNLRLDPEAVKAVQSFEGVEECEPSPENHYNRALSASNEAPVGRSFVAPDHKDTVFRRAGQWVKQENADGALVVVSEYKNMPMENARDFVYMKDAGKDVYVYVIDAGVNLQVENIDGEKEFISDGGKVLQTQLSIDEGKNKDDDDAPTRADSHGTLVASKAVGKKYGVAKQAILISVKISVPNSVDLYEGLKLVVADIKAHPGRELKSVVTTSRSLAKDLSYDKVKAFKEGLKALYVRPIEQLFDLGVPFVCSAGNAALESADIDELPMVVKDEKHPIINVGAMEWYGNRAIFSQYGPQLDVYALGERIIGQTKEDKIPSKEIQGTSFAAPQVAGLVATYLSSTPISDQWNSLQGYKRVEAIRDYLVSEKSSHTRRKDNDLRVIWNGATEEDHKSVGANPHSDAVPEPAAPKGRALSIILQWDQSLWSRYRWYFFPTKQGESALCKTAGKGDFSQEARFQSPDQNSPPPYPSGEIQLDDIDDRECNYKNDGKDNAGMLFCTEKDGKVTSIPCHTENMRKLPVKDMTYCRPNIYQQPVVYCEW